MFPVSQRRPQLASAPCSELRSGQRRRSPLRLGNLYRVGTLALATAMSSLCASHLATATTPAANQPASAPLPAAQPPLASKPVLTSAVAAPVPATSLPSPTPISVNLADAIAKARESLDKAHLPKPEEARKQLVDQMQAFESYLGGTQSPNAQAWFKFLSWDALLREVALPTPNLRALTDVQLRYRQNIPGLEYAPFQAMARAIERFIDAQRFGGDPEATIRTLDTRLERLLDIAAADSEASQLERARDYSLIAGYLSSSNQAPELVNALRSLYRQPNVRVVAGETLINRAVGRPVSQPAPVDECILGTHVLGNSCVNGNLFADLVPHNGGISVRLNLSGTFTSNNIGYNRGVQIYTTGTSPVHASKLVTITPNGTYTQPAWASTSLQTQINGIGHHSRLVRRIASRKAAEQKAEANAIGQYRLQNRLGQRFNNEVEQQLSESDGRLAMLNQDRVELIRLGLPKPTWDIHSTDSQVLANFLEAANTQYGAPGVSNLPVPNSDAVAEFHQSLPINLAGPVLGGRTIHSWEMDDFVRQFGGTVTPELQEESEGEPWSLTFADHHPVEVEFLDGLANITLRISRMTRGEQELAEPATVSAKYRATVQDGVLTLQRQGDVELNFVRAAGGVRAVTLRAFLKGKFDKFFKEVGQTKRIVLGGRMPNMPPLVLTGVVFGNGWAQISLR